MNKEIQYPNRLYTFEYKHLLLTLVKENPNHHFNITSYPLEKMMNDSIKKVLRNLDNDEKDFFQEIQSLIKTKIDSDELYLLYRGTNKTKYPNIKKDSDLESVSNFFDNYIHGSEKGGYSLSGMELGTMNDISDELFQDLFNKINISLDSYEDTDSFKEYFQNKNNINNFILNIQSLEDEQKIRLKDYYFAYLHTVGTKDSGKAISYFVSTTKNISIGIDFFTKHEINKEHQVLTYYLLVRPYLGSAIDSHENISLDKLSISTSFPRYEALHDSEDEVSIKGGLFPNHILGIRCYIGENEVFLVNPYLFMGRSIEKMLIEGIPVNQREVRNQISRNELDIIYKYKNEVFE